MRRDGRIVCLGVLIIQSAIPICGFSQESYTTPRSADVNEIRFKVAEEPVEMKLFRADKELLEQAFAARIRLRSFDQQFAGSIIGDDELAAVRERSQFRRQSILFQGIRVSGGDKTVSEFFRTLADSTPEEVRPQEGDLAFFMSEDANKGYVSFDSHPKFEARSSVVEFTILAPSEDVAKTRTQTLVTLLKIGIADPIREHLKKRHTNLAAEVETRKAKLEKARQARLEVTKKLEEAADIVGVELSRLKTQRRMLDVEVAGVRARIRAVEKLRKDRENNPSVGKKLDDIKMTSEIDLAGLAARKEALTEVIKLGEQRAALENKSKQLTQAFLEAQNRLRSAKKRVDRHRPALEAAETLCLLHGDEVTITPIKWTK